MVQLWAHQSQWFLPTFTLVVETIALSKEHYLALRCNCSSNMIYLFTRFIDDTLIIICCRNKFLKIINALNAIRPRIKYTFELDTTKHNFLDITIFKGKLFNESNLFDIELFQKHMNVYLYIPSFSYHNKNVFIAFIQAKIKCFYKINTCP